MQRGLLNGFAQNLPLRQDTKRTFELFQLEMYVLMIYSNIKSLLYKYVPLIFTVQLGVILLGLRRQVCTFDFHCPTWGNSVRSKETTLNKIFFILLSTTTLIIFVYNATCIIDQISHKYWFKC